jgi:hypothetical protein
MGAYGEFHGVSVVQVVSDRIFHALFVLGVAGLSFICAVLLTNASIFPTPQLVDGYRAAVALLDQRHEINDRFNTDLWRRARTERRGVTVYRPGQVSVGYTLYTSGEQAAAWLIDLNGQVVHQWTLPFSRIWDASAAVRDPVPDTHVWMRKAMLLPNGDLLALYEGAGDTPYGYGLVRMDADGRVIWKYLQHTHHDFDLAPDGRIFVLIHEMSEQPYKPRMHLKTPRLDDSVVELSPDGRELARVKLLDAMNHTPFLHFLDDVPWYQLDARDFLHTNAVRFVADARSPAVAEPGQLLLSMRELGALAVLDFERGRIVWGLRGDWVGQHDPDLLPDGRILMFDNNGDLDGDGRSRVIEFDPRNSAMYWIYRGTPEQPLDSTIRAEQQRLPNGNTLITESDGGRLLEVTRDGRVVWEYVVPVRGGPGGTKLPVLASGQRIDPQTLDPAFRSRLMAAEVARRPP